MPFYSYKVDLKFCVSSSSVFLKIFLPKSHFILRFPTFFLRYFANRALGLLLQRWSRLGWVQSEQAFLHERRPSNR